MVLEVLKIELEIHRPVLLETPRPVDYFSTNKGEVFEFLAFTTKFIKSTSYPDLLRDWTTEQDVPFEEMLQTAIKRTK